MSMKQYMIGIFCVLALLFSCGLPAAAETTAVSSEVAVETESDGKTGEVRMVLGIFTITAGITAASVVILKRKKTKAVEKQKTDSEEKKQS